MEINLNVIEIFYNSFKYILINATEQNINI